MNQKSVVIVGGGPAGATAATLMARASATVMLFDAGNRPELVVGESLIPSCVPYLQKLGIEDEVRRYSTVKPGASFVFRGEERSITHFKEFEKAASLYAYNVPRHKFDETLLRTAKEAGVHVVERRAKLVADGDNRLALDEESSSICEEFLDVAQAFIIDASGRARLSSRALGIGEKVGDRKDVAIFAHIDPIEDPLPGYVHINRLRAGWSWRIPLPGKLSVGVVASPEALGKFGNSAEEQYDALLKDEPVLSQLTTGANRTSRVMKYSNYQLISDRFVGENWAAVGDAAGFVDPIFSSGLSLALEGGVLIAEVLQRGASQKALMYYQESLRKKLTAWQEVAVSFYDGSLAGLVRARRLTAHSFPWGLILPLFEKRFQKVFTGMVSPLSMDFRLARFALAHGPGAEFGSRMRVR